MTVGWRYFIVRGVLFRIGISYGLLRPYRKSMGAIVDHLKNGCEVDLIPMEGRNPWGNKKMMTKQRAMTLIRDRWMVLYVGPDGAELRPRKDIDAKFGSTECFSVPANVLEELRPLMSPLTERRFNYKTGWREIGLPDPSPGEYWLFTQ